MQKADTLTYDPVHDAQRVYRQLVDSLARPGKINTIQEVCATFPSHEAGHRGLLACAFALLDREVTFAVLAPEGKAQELTEVIRLETLSTPVAVAEADYVFIDPIDCVPTSIHEIMGQLKQGTLTDPQRSATVFLVVDAFGETNGLEMALRGPGIETERQISVSALAHEWLTARAEVNIEYPLGIDMVLFARTGEIVGLPRTTAIQMSSAAKEV